MNKRLFIIIALSISMLFGCSKAAEKAEVQQNVEVPNTQEQSNENADKTDTKEEESTKVKNASADMEESFNETLPEGQFVKISYDTASSSIQFNGVSLSSTHELAVNNLGTPAEEGNREKDGLVYNNFSYPDSWFDETVSTVYTKEDLVESATYQTVSAGYFLPDEEFFTSFDGEIYRQAGTSQEYVFVSPTKQVLILYISPDTSAEGVGNFIHDYFLFQMDENFIDDTYEKIDASEIQF